MQVPVDPPLFDDLLADALREDPAAVGSMLGSAMLTDGHGRYLHWDKLRHLPNPPGLTHARWWLGLKLARRARYQVLPFLDRQGRPLRFCLLPTILERLHWLDRHAAGSLRASAALPPEGLREAYLIRSLIEEAIHSSQLEGASTTRDVAREMIRQGRAPRSRGEQMILNNHNAMQLLRESRTDPLTPQQLCELQRLLTQDTLDDEDQAGRLRHADEDIKVVDNASRVVLHVPPAADELPRRMQALCDFANGPLADATPDASETFLHPVIRAIALHFMLAYDHPFCDGNGRTARALFYWSMLRQGYWLTEYLSISRAIKQAPARYGRAFLHTETDDNDLTYFLIHQLDALADAVSALHQYLDQKQHELRDAEQQLAANPRLRGRLNFRQLSLLRHALKHPRFAYVVEEHQRSHGISYDIARKDLLFMADELRLLNRAQEGKRYLFIVPEDLEQRLRRA